MALASPQATVRLAETDDLERLKALDPWPREHAWRQKIAASEVMVLELGSRRTRRIAGLLRFVVLWTTVPFLELIVVEGAQRGLGHSRRLLDALKHHLRAEGYVALLSSSQTDEPSAQAWHSHMGFRSNGIIEHIADDNVGEIIYRVLL